jgi:hypothetical protein
MADEPEIKLPGERPITPIAPPPSPDRGPLPPPEAFKRNTPAETFEAVGMPRVPPMAAKSPIKRAFSLKNNQVMVLTEDGNRIWLTPGEAHGDEELQAEYQAFLARGGKNEQG